MNQEENTENQATNAEVKTAPLVPGQNRRRHGSRRPRFKREHRGDQRGARADQGGQPPRPAEEAQRRPSSTIRGAIDLVEHIRAELKKVLDDIHQVLRTLEQVEREKSASEEEIQLLRESLRLLHREPGYPRQGRHSPPPRSSPPSGAASAEAEVLEDDED